MKITQLKGQVRDENRVSVFVDNKYSFSLTLDQLLSEKLKKDIELDDVRLGQLKKLSTDGKLKARALEWVMSRPRSKKEFADYMFKKKVDPDLRDGWIEEFERKGYLNDERFTEWLVELRKRKNKSSREIQFELAKNRISADVIAKSLQLDDTDSLKKLIEKLSTRSRYQDEKKLIEYLMRKGFRYSEIQDALTHDQ